MIPYIGPSAQHFPLNKTRWYGSDNPERARELGKNPESEENEWLYSFNSLGYRGVEFDSSADISIFVSGCSITVGEAVPWADSWPVQFEKQAQHSFGTTTSLLNMGQSGAPNEYISRSLLAQIHHTTPTVAVALFSGNARVEYLKGTVVEHIGPWRKDALALDYYAHYTEEIGTAGLLRNILTLQYACDRKDIVFIFGSVEFDKLENILEHKNPIIRQLASMIRWDAYMNFPPRSHFIDTGRDESHPGPKSHRSLAGAIFSLWPKKD